MAVVVVGVLVLIVVLGAVKVGVVVVRDVLLVVVTCSAWQW